MNANLRTVERLLRRRFEELEELFQRKPFSQEVGMAVTIKEFMQDHAIGSIEDGLDHFFAFKARQNALLKI